MISYASNKIQNEMEDDIMADAEPVKPSSSQRQPSQIPWIEKYRPATLDDVIAQKEIVNTIRRLMDENKMPHLLLYGPPGTGKTSTVLAIAKKLFGQNFRGMTLELNASDDRQIDVVREKIKNFASTRSILSSGFKLIILDEADAMKNEAQMALRRVIEKYAANARFCLICNYVGKIIPALQSRCTKFRFGPLNPEEMRDRVDYIINQEQVRVTPDGLQAMERLCGGDMRRYLNILQACSMAFEEVNEDNVYACTGNPRPKDIQIILDAMLNHPFDDAYQQVHDLSVENGYAVADLVKELHAFVLSIGLPEEQLIFVTENLADLEYRMCTSANDKVQLAALVSIFQIVRAEVMRAVKK